MVKKYFFYLHQIAAAMKRVAQNVLTPPKYPLAVVIPFHKERFSKEEKENVDSCFLKAPLDAHFFFLLKKKCDPSYFRYNYPQAKIYFLEGWLDTYSSYCQLKANRYYYKLFYRYKWILTFEPDAYLYRNDLNQWLSSRYDVYGAPWTRSDQDNIHWVGVGNGGFCLRKSKIFYEYFKIIDIFLLIEKLKKLFIKNKKKFKNIILELKESKAEDIVYKNFDLITEDAFWSSKATEIYLSLLSHNRLIFILMFWWLSWKLNIPRCDEAGKFSIETNPRWVLKEIKEIPLGSHKLPTYDESLHESLVRKSNIESIKVAYHALTNWENDYVKFLLNFCQKVDIFYWKNLNDISSKFDDKFDVLVFTTQKISSNEARFLIQKIKPKIVIHCSDEDGSAAHSIFSKGKFLYLKQYSHGRFKNQSLKEIQIPLGFMVEMFDNDPFSRELVPIEMRDIPWSFVGNLKQDRKNMIENFFKMIPNGIAITDGSLHPSEMRNVYERSIFVPNGRGQVNVDCFRIYEAMFCGSVPVIACSNLEFKKTFSYNGDLPPILRFDSWEEAAQCCRKLLEQPITLKNIQIQNYIWIRKKISRIQQLIFHELSSNNINYMLHLSD